ncbi:MAG: thermonuclease family protein [Thermodesulfovibrionales bacterium]|jgi:micrococcal nuclease
MKPSYYTRILLPLFLLMIVTSPLAETAEAGQKTCRVIRVYDGDTIAVQTGGFAGFFTKEEKVRLIGIDAPEMRQEPWGRRSKRRLKELISRTDSTVALQSDVEPRDKYGRLLAYVWDKKGQLLNEKMIEDGYALLYTFPPNVRYVERLRQAEERARIARKGIWGKGGLRKKPSQWRREHPRR